MAFLVDLIIVCVSLVSTDITGYLSLMFYVWFLTG
jgi:hypothetical protein